MEVQAKTLRDELAAIAARLRVLQGAEEKSLLAEWLQRRCQDQNPAAVLMSLVWELSRVRDWGAVDVSVRISDAPRYDAPSVQRIVLEEVARELYREHTGGALDIRRKLAKGYAYGRGVRVVHMAREGAGTSLCGQPRRGDSV